MTIRVMSPAVAQTRIIEGRTYVGTPGTILDLPDADALTLGANGFTVCAKQGVGTTAQRPAAPNRGDQYIDTSLAAHITFDGALWRNTVTHAAV